MSQNFDLGTNAKFFDMLGVVPAQLQNTFPDTIEMDRMGNGFQQDGLRSGLLCTARSGSSLLSVALQAYGFDFQEFLNPNGYLRDLIAQEDVTALSDLAPKLEASARENGRLSIKLPVVTLSYLFLMGEFPANIDRWRFVYLRRSNLVQQAISAVIAKRTNKWTAVMEAKGSVDVDDFDFDEIMKGVTAASNGNRLLERFIGLFGLTVHNVVYEDFLKDQKAGLREIAAFLGADPADYPNAAEDKPWITKQATSLNDIWEDRFRTEVRRRSLPVFAGQ